MPFMELCYRVYSNSCWLFILQIFDFCLDIYADLSYYLDTAITNLADAFEVVFGTISQFWVVSLIFGRGEHLYCLNKMNIITLEYRL